MYEVLIGFNIKLAQNETWDISNGGTVTLDEEIRFEKGDIIGTLPKLADEQFLTEFDVIKKSGESDLAKRKPAPARKAVKHG
jgi:hypothetical protein